MDQNLQSLSTRAKAGAVGCTDVVDAGCNGVKGSYKEGVDKQEEVELIEVGGERNVVVGGCGDGDGDVHAAGGDRRVSLALLEGGGEGNSCKEEESEELHDGHHLAGCVGFVCCDSHVSCLIESVLFTRYDVEREEPGQAHVETSAHVET
jgi:hypothetical protein